MILIFLILLISSCESVSNNDCDLSSNFINKIQKSDLIIVGRILNYANNDIVVSVIRILKGFELINEVKKISHNNDYHLIVVRNIKYIKSCKIEAKSGEDFLFYLNKTNEHNFFQLKYVIEFGDGSFEKRISAFINGGTSKLIQSNDPCSKLNCRYGAQCQQWPGNPPTAVCHCSTTQCSSGLREHQVCGNDGVLYETACHMKKQECILQKSIKSVSLQICDSSLAQNNYGKTDVQQDEISQFKSLFCQNQNCPPYATCVNHPYPHCKCPNDNCSPNDSQICGTDEITYTNICELKKVSCKANRLIEKQYEGRCDMCKFTKCDFHGICEMTEDGTGTRCKCRNAEEVCLNTHLVAVCGSDDITYKSECHMQIEACRRKALLTVIHKGECQIKIHKDICSQQLCRYGAKCQTNLKKSIFEAQCSCDHIDCGQTLNHNVCGDDGKTYKNPCLLNKAMCEKQISISVLYEGPCDQNPCLGVKCSGPHQYCKVDVNGKGRCVCPEESCPKVVQPVCGNDNVTYDSICHLTRTACTTEKLLWVLHNGVCSEEPRCQEQGYDCSTYQVCRSDVKQTKCECPTCPDSGIGEYVCGSDEKTYRSECHLRSHACITNSVELKVANIGSCDACQHKKCLFYSVCRKFRFEDPQCICPTDCVYERRPVCGSDDRTYENECFLKVKSCAENKLITVFSEGPCKKCPENCSLGWMCKRGKCVCADRCPKLKLRVCGTDGNYYDNECELKRKACIDNKTIKIDMSDASCTSRQYISDETGPNNNKNIDNSFNGKSCFCNKRGSINIECDTPTPHCTCKTGVTGQYCNKCSDGYWNFSESGCIACSCNKFGSESIQCNVETGKCSCKTLAMGKYCSVCPTGYSMSNDGCKENSQNENKIDSAELGFMTDSFVKSSWSGNAENYLHINISFVPYNSEGVIFYHSDPDRSSDFLSIILKNKYVEYRTDLGSGILLLKSGAQIDLGRSHSVLVERLNRYSRLVVDNTDSHFGMSPSFLSNLDAGVQFFLGKAPQLEANTLSHTNYITDSFFGCLSSLKIIAGEETNYYLMNQQTSWITESSNVKLNCPHIDFKHNINVIEDIDKENIKENIKENLKSNSKDYCESHKPCLNGGICKTVSEEIYNCQCLPGYQGYNCEDMVSHIWKFKDSSFVIVPSESLQLRQRIKLEISFLPTLGNGLLAFISDGHDRNPAFISVLLYNNRVEVRCRTPIGVTRLTSAEFIKISRWNQVVVLKAAKYIYLNLNQSPQPIKKRLIPKGFMNVDSYVLRKLSQFRITNQPIFFGGVDHNIYTSFSNVVSLKPHFQGAIQKILVNGESIRFQSSDIILKNITQWQGAPCGPLYNPCSKIDPEKSYCIAEMNKSMCFCNPKQEHWCIRNSMQHDNPANTIFNRKFSGQSCAKFTAAKQKRVKSTTKNNIRIKFKTESNDGLLLLMKNNYSTKMHFFAIVLRNSVIEVAINLGGNNGIIRITSNRNVSDNKWHAIQIIRNNRNVVLLVDNRMFRARMLKDHFHNALETDGWMWLGGLRKPVNGFPWEYNTNFQGCIAELYVDEVAFNLINDARKNIGPVLKC